MQDYDTEIRRLTLAMNKIDGAYYFFARKLGIKENTLAVLYAIDDGKPHSQKQICEEWLIPKTTISTIIKELTGLGIVCLLPAGHTKEKTICLTDKGRRYVNKILKPVYEAERQAIESTFREFSPECVAAMEHFAKCLCTELEKRSLEE